MNDTRPSEGPNIPLVPAAPTHLNPCLGTPALSPPALASLKLSLVQVKQKEIPISLQTLCQSQSLKRVAAEAGLYTEGDKGRLCALVCAQLVHAQHADAAPGADKETLKHLLPLRYNGKTVIECDQFLSQLCMYWIVNTLLTTIKLKGATTPSTNKAAFAIAFKACFGHLDDKAVAQVKLAKLCANKFMHEKRTAAEFSALFKGPADRSGYGDLELHNKYLGGIPSRIYHKIELETFTWEDADKHAMEVKQQLDISRACWPELNNFFSARGRGCGGAHGGAP
ncbi:predicted protein [Postia placenta Mad-698-R]|nr:predicted protein [Postia placenta Mad-698-R]